MSFLGFPLEPLPPPNAYLYHVYDSCCSTLSLPSVSTTRCLLKSMSLWNRNTDSLLQISTWDIGAGQATMPEENGASSPRASSRATQCTRLRLLWIAQIPLISKRIGHPPCLDDFPYPCVKLPAVLRVLLNQPAVMIRRNLRAISGCQGRLRSQEMRCDDECIGGFKMRHSGQFLRLKGHAMSW